MTGTVLMMSSASFEYLLADMISTIIGSVMFHTAPTAGRYRKVKWFSLNVASDSVFIPPHCSTSKDVAFYLETMVKNRAG